MALKKLVVPDSGSLIPDGQATPEMMALFNSMAGFTGSVKAFVEAGTVDDILLVIEFPEEKDYPIFRNASFARTITQITAICSAGSCDVTGKIGATPLGGDPNSVTTSESIEEHDEDNVAAIGSDGYINVDNVSGCETLVVSIKYERAFS